MQVASDATQEENEQNEAIAHYTDHDVHIVYIELYTSNRFLSQDDRITWNEVNLSCLGRFHSAEVTEQ